MIRNCGVEPTVIEYLKDPPDREALHALLAAMDMPARELLREKGTPYQELGLDNRALSDEQLIEAILAHPILMNRPIVITPLGTKLCRPSDTVLDLLPNAQREDFIREDGSVIPAGTRANG